MKKNKNLHDFAEQCIELYSAWDKAIPHGTAKGVVITTAELVIFTALRDYEDQLKAFAMVYEDLKELARICKEESEKLGTWHN